MTIIIILSLASAAGALVAVNAGLRLHVKQLTRERDDLLAERDRYFWAIVSRARPAEDDAEVSP